MRLSAPLEHFQRRLAQAWRERAVTLKAASFALVGVVNTVVDYGVFLAGYYLLGLPLIPANVLAWLVAVSGSYVMNCYFTFAAESGRQLRWRAYGAFVASGIAGVITNTAVLVLALGDRSELRGQFLAFPFRRIQVAPGAAGTVGGMTRAEKCAAAAVARGA